MTARTLNSLLLRKLFGLRLYLICEGHFSGNAEASLPLRLEVSLVDGVKELTDALGVFIFINPT